MKISKGTKRFVIGFVIYLFVIEFLFITFRSTSTIIAVVGLTSITPILGTIFAMLVVDQRKNMEKRNDEKQVI